LQFELSATDKIEQVLELSGTRSGNKGWDGTRLKRIIEKVVLSRFKADVFFNNCLLINNYFCSSFTFGFSMPSIPNAV
jgi:hypothetical protein